MFAIRLPILSNHLALSSSRPPRSPPIKPQSHTLYFSNSHHNPPADPAVVFALRQGIKVRALSTDGLNPVHGDEEPLPAGLQRETMPKHVAVIMDGNGRWARQRGLPTWLGHRAGVKVLRETINSCRKWDIRVLTVFMFSLDNWVRPKIEVQALISLFQWWIKSDINTLAREGVRISVIGDVSKLPDSSQKLISEVVEKTKDNTKLQLIMALSYSGKYDIVQACKGVSKKVKDGLIQVADINESVFEQELGTNCSEFPYPDLLIRTSGELRISNFLLWQLAYTELYFAPALWPDFGKAEFAEALISFQQRKRRYGSRNS